MATTVRIYCDQCHGECLTVTVGNIIEARNDTRRKGWSYFYDSEHGDMDLCPVCNGKDPTYWESEPF